jgi:hypothetical protein
VKRLLILEFCAFIDYGPSTILFGLLEKNGLRRFAAVRQQSVYILTGDVLIHFSVKAA